MIKKNKLNHLISFLIFGPLLIVFGDRSYIAQDEGYYALQAKTILETNDWITPSWLGEPVFDRTIGVQWLIAGSQKIFGETIFAAHIPSLISAVITLVLTYQISLELINRKQAWISPIILATSYLWINNAHLASQDMPLLALEILGIWALIKYQRERADSYIIIVGLVVGLAFMLKTVMILIPVISLIPFIYYHRLNIIRSRLFWVALLTGFMPFILWTFASISEYGIEEYSLIINKVNYLSKSSQFSKSLFYYIWNIPLNTFPWSFLSILGLSVIFKHRKINNDQFLLLFCYPLIFLILLSLFNTKTPYYPLQLTPFIAISAGIGLRHIFSENIISKKFARILFILIGISFIISSIIIRNLSIYTEVDYINFKDSVILYSLLILGVSWASIIFIHKQKHVILLTLIGPYLAFSLIAQSTLLTDRDPSIKTILQNNDIAEILQRNSINIISEEDLDSEAFTKLVKISIHTPHIGSYTKGSLSTKKTGYFWVHKSSPITNSKKLKVIEENDVLDPWILISSDIL